MVAKLRFHNKRTSEWLIAGELEGPIDPPPTPFPVSGPGGVGMSEAHLDALKASYDSAGWALTEYNALAASNRGNVNRNYLAFGASISVTDAVTVYADAEWALAQALLWWCDRSATRLSRLQGYLDRFRFVTSWGKDAGTYRLKVGWIVACLTRAAAIIEYRDPAFVDNFLINLCWVPSDPVQGISGATALDWAGNGNWILLFAECKFGIAVLKGDEALWNNAKEYFSRRLRETIFHPTYETDGKIFPLRNHNNTILTTGTMNHWNHQGAALQIDSDFSPITSYTPFPAGRNAETIRDFGHVSMGLASAMHCAWTIQAQDETLTVEDHTRLKTGMNYHASRVWPWVNAGTKVAPWPYGNGPTDDNAVGGGFAHQGWITGYEYLNQTGEASSDLVSLRNHTWTTAHPAAGALHIAGERLARR